MMQNARNLGEFGYQNVCRNHARKTFMSRLTAIRHKYIHMYSILHAGQAMKSTPKSSSESTSSESTSSESTSSESTSSATEIVRTLRAQLQALEGVHRSRDAAAISSGCEALDRLLPSGGFFPGQLVEWLVARPGNGGGTLALLAARAVLLAGNKALIVVDRCSGNERSTFYPPAVAGWEIDLRRLVILRPRNAADEIWAIDQALRCSSVAAVWAWLPKLNERDFRRLQLAAEQGGSLGLLLRPARLRGRPTWADIQLFVEPLPSFNPQQQNHNTSHYAPPPLRRRWQITLLRCRGAVADKTRLLEMDETTGTLQEITRPSEARAPDHEKSALPLAAQLARPTTRRHSARA
jgi:hypothetical protein